MNLVTLVLACSLYPDHSLVYAMTQVGSKNNSLVSTVTGEIKTVEKEQEAIEDTRKQLAKGTDLDIGLMQIPSRWISILGWHLSDLFRPCKNMVLATQLMNQLHQECLDEKPPTNNVTTCLLSKYKSTNSQQGLDYATSVMAYEKQHPFSELEKKIRNPAMHTKKSSS